MHVYVVVTVIFIIKLINKIDIKIIMGNIYIITIIPL